MRSIGWLWVVAALWGCTKEDEEKVEPAPTPTPSTCTTDLRWERELQGFFSNWCTPCHSSAVTGESRRGAPLGLDFDTLDDVRALAARVEATSTGEDISMPPAGGTPLEDRAMVAEWIRCGMPGTEVAPAADCDDAIELEAPAILSGGDGATLCDGVAHGRIPSGLTIDGDVRLDCVCEIGGDVVVSAGSLASTQLWRIDGGLTITGSATGVDAPELTELGGGLEVRGATDLSSLELRWLRTVGGPLSLVDNPVLSTFIANRIGSVVGSVTLEDLPALDDVESLVGIHEVSGDLVIRRTGVRALDDMRGFEAIDGALIVEQNAALESLRGFWFLEEVGGGITLSDNPVLQGIDGFDLLSSTPRLAVAGNGSLVELRFPALQEVVDASATEPTLTVSGSPQLSRLSMQLLADVSHLEVRGSSLTDLSGLASLSAVDTLVLRDNDALLSIDYPAELGSMSRLEVVGNGGLTSLPGLAGLGAVEGDVILDDNPSLHDLTGLTELASVGGALRVRGAVPLKDLSPLGALAVVGGTLELSRLDAVTDLQALTRLESIGGDLLITDNRSLPTEEAVGFAQHVDTIGGTVTIKGNQ